MRTTGTDGASARRRHAGGSGPASRVHAGDELLAAVVRDLAALRPVLAAAGFGLGVAVVSEPGAEPAGPAEAAAAASMPSRRRLEFLAGRRAARRALRAVGLDCGEIPRAGRLPVFPPGRAASITHSEGIAVAVARGPGRDLPLGCDLELRPLPRGAARLVLHADEEALLGGDGDACGGGAAWSVTELFSAKEAAWKALAAAEGEHRDGPARSLRELRASPCGNGLRVGARAGLARAVRVRVERVGGAGVFSHVVGRAGDHGCAGGG
ncbi:enterobactin synthetase [Streptomyces sp. NPDC003877]